MALAGEAYMKEIDMEKVKEIEKELSKLAKTISEEWKLRHVQSPLKKAASAVLGKEAVEDRLEEDTTGDDPVTRGHRQMLRKLEGLIKLLPQYQQDKFDAVEILPGYLSWYEFMYDLQACPESVPLNEVYSVWYKKQVKKENSPECNSKFAEEICLEHNLSPLGMYAYIGNSKLSNQSFLPSCIYTPLILQYTLSIQ